MSSTAYCFDLDGTVTTKEILPLIASTLDISDEINSLTSATIQGVIPFESSFKLRVKLLQSTPISVINKIVSSIPLGNRVVEFIQSHKNHSYIITGNLDVWVSGLCKKIGCEFFSSIANVEGDKLLGIQKILIKGQAIDQLREKYDRIVVVGDGMNDVPMFEKGDLRIAYGGVHSPVHSLIAMADFITYHEDGLCNILNTL